MNVEQVRTLFDYSYWARDRLLVALEGMPEAEFARPNSFTFGSIRGIFHHLLDAEYQWRCKFEGQSPASEIPVAEMATPALLAERWQQEEARMRTYLATLAEPQLTADLVYRSARGEPRHFPNFWVTLLHVVNHSTQHRSEIAEALTMIGRSPGELGLGAYAGEVGLQHRWNPNPPTT